MSKVIVRSLEDPINFAYHLGFKFIEKCPEDVWGETFGGWPVWQQLFHPFANVDDFLRPKDAPPAINPFEPSVSKLIHISFEIPAKLLITDHINLTQEAVSRYAAALDDASLARINEGLTARSGKETTHAATLAMIGAHIMYHLGSCDAALRAEGLPGLY